MNNNNKYDIFISYRRFDSKGRTSGRDIARTIKLELEKRGYKVFFDYSELKDNEFENIILPAVRNSKALLFILSEDSLVRCANEGDWVRREIYTAIETGVKIIPINPDNAFNGWPENLPKELESLKRQQFSDINMGSLFEKSVDKLIEDRLASKKTSILTPQEQLWESVNKDNYDEVLDFLTKVPTQKIIPDLWEKVEKRFWVLTLNQESVNSFIKFKEIFPKSKFSEDASKMVSDCQKWESVKQSRDILKVRDFLGKNNRIISKKEVTLLYEELRSSEISRIKEDLRNFPIRRLVLLINYECVSKADFTPEEWDKIQDIVMWKNVDKRNILSLQGYLKDRPNSIFSMEAGDILNGLKKEELDKMVDSPEAFSARTIMDYLDSMLLSQDDLFNVGVATKESLQKMKNENLWDSPPEAFNGSYQISTGCPEM